MHLMIFLIAFGALVAGLSFIAETYADYQAHFLGFTALYFMAWWSASKLLRVGATTTEEAAVASSSSPPAPGYLERFARLPFLAVASLYVAGLAVLFAATLLVAGHTFRAWMVAAFGFGIAIAIAATSDQSPK